jgi:hypothetical protein
VEERRVEGRKGKSLGSFLVSPSLFGMILRGGSMQLWHLSLVLGQCALGVKSTGWIPHVNSSIHFHHAIGTTPDAGFLKDTTKLTVE